MQYIGGSIFSKQGRFWIIYFGRLLARLTNKKQLKQNKQGLSFFSRKPFEKIFISGEIVASQSWAIFYGTPGIIDYYMGRGLFSRLSGENMDVT